ncbi:Transcription factor MYC/MYB N-terminal [Dillenia turbinata]|uniref:Transcription factor MYC/MYB N-terminal n=1 Tax=Dillenia turbinata TaxID=194707 RepID=A0AAN8ZI63_9MAGN
MEGGVPMLNCLLQHTLRSLCSCSSASSSSSSDSSNSSNWVYSVFWRILPRNYPPPKWDYGGGSLDRSKGNKRNWILVWEDGYCDFCECERAGSGYANGRFGADIFFKMSHEVYSYGEGLVGKVAADKSHKWVFKENPNEHDPNFMSSWNVSIEPVSVYYYLFSQPRAWETQFNSGIQTIAIISVREGIIQLGSFDKIAEDLNLVISIQRKFSYLQSIPGVFSVQRPYLPIQQNQNSPKINTQMMIDSNGTYNYMPFSDKQQHHLAGMKRVCGGSSEKQEECSVKSINMGWNSPQIGLNNGPPPFWSIPPLLPTVPCSLGALLSTLPSVLPSNGDTDNNLASLCYKFNADGANFFDINHQVAQVKVEPSCIQDLAHDANKSNSGLAVEMGFVPIREEES